MRKKAEKELKKRYAIAEEIIKDKNKLDDFLERLERKIKEIPKIGEKLSHVIVMVSLVKHYATKEYTDFPMASLIAVVAALVYFISPIDLIPDGIPIAGYVDDALVVAVCWSIVETDVDRYLEWRDNNKETES